MGRPAGPLHDAAPSSAHRPFSESKAQIVDRHAAALSRALFTLVALIRGILTSDFTIRFLRRYASSSTRSRNERAGWMSRLVHQIRGRRKRCSMTTVVTRKGLEAEEGRHFKTRRPQGRRGFNRRGDRLRRYQRLSDDLGAGDQRHRTPSRGRLLLGGQGDRRSGRKGSWLQGHDAEPGYLGCDQPLYQPA